ncbi:hypothetical protein BDK51DRAFT_48858, partial [Blyttiomyces helicus]
ATPHVSTALPLLPPGPAALLSTSTSTLHTLYEAQAESGVLFARADALTAPTDPSTPTDVSHAAPKLTLVSPPNKRVKRSDQARLMAELEAAQLELDEVDRDRVAIREEVRTLKRRRVEKDAVFGEVLASCLDVDVAMAGAILAGVAAPSPIDGDILVTAKWSIIVPVFETPLRGRGVSVYLVLGSGCEIQAKKIACLPTGVHDSVIAFLTMLPVYFLRSGRASEALAHPGQMRVPGI